MHTEVSMESMLMEELISVERMQLQIKAIFQKKIARRATWVIPTTQGIGISIVLAWNMIDFNLHMGSGDE